MNKKDADRNRKKKLTPSQQRKVDQLQQRLARSNRERMNHPGMIQAENVEIRDAG